MYLKACVAYGLKEQDLFQVNKGIKGRYTGVQGDTKGARSSMGQYRGTEGNTN